MCAGEDDAEVLLRARALTDVGILGWQPDVTYLLAAADTFVLPTTAEGSHWALLEGWAPGLSGVVSAVPELTPRDRSRAAWRRARSSGEAHGDRARSKARWAEWLS